MIHGVNFKVKI